MMAARASRRPLGWSTLDPGVLRQRCIFHVLQNVRDAVRGAGLSRKAKQARRTAVLQAAAPIWQATDRGTVRRAGRRFRSNGRPTEPEAVAVIARVWDQTLAYLTVLEHARERGEGVGAAVSADDQRAGTGQPRAAAEDAAGRHLPVRHGARRRHRPSARASAPGSRAHAGRSVDRGARGRLIGRLAPALCQHSSVHYLPPVALDKRPVGFIMGAAVGSQREGRSVRSRAEAGHRRPTACPRPGLSATAGRSRRVLCRPPAPRLAGPTPRNRPGWRDLIARPRAATLCSGSPRRRASSRERARRRVRATAWQPAVLARTCRRNLSPNTGTSVIDAALALPEYRRPGTSPIASPIS